MEIAVVPCCVDTDHFSPEAADREVVSRYRQGLGIGSDTFVLTYVGSLGTRYMLTEMMQFLCRTLTEAVKPHRYA